MTKINLEATANGTIIVGTANGKKDYSILNLDKETSETLVKLKNRIEGKKPGTQYLKTHYKVL